MSAPQVEPVPSPCISICRMNEASGLCEGCWRTLDEIGLWSVLDEDDKSAVWFEIRRRQRQASTALLAPTQSQGSSAP